MATSTNPRIQLDLTPWVRAPHSGIGRTARRTFEAVREALAPSGIEIGSVSRTSRIPPHHHHEVRRIGLLERGLGSRQTLHHAFEHRLAPLKRSTRLLSIHDLWTLREGNAYQSRKFQQAQAPTLRKAIERADWITTPLPSVLDELHRLFPDTASRSSAIPWASTLDAATAPQPISQIDGSGRPFILTVAVVENRKNLPLLARALAGITGLDWLVLGKVGFGGEECLKQMRAEVPGLIHLSDLTEGELVWAYQHAAALVLPSFEEGFGLPVLEAAQFGTPLVLSRIPAFTDITERASPSCALFFDSEHGLREILHEIAGDPGSPLLPGSLHLAPHYSWQSTASRFIELYRELSPPAVGYPAP